MGSKVAVNGFDNLYAVPDYERRDAEAFGLTLPFSPLVYGELTPMGEVQISDHVTVQISVSAYPARFYTFTVITEDVSEVVLESDSGRLPEYWDRLISYLNTGVLPVGLTVGD